MSKSQFESDDEENFKHILDDTQNSETKNIPILDCNFPTQEHQNALMKNFGHTEFRPLQWKIISSILNKRDVCAVIATGYGKSLCFQYPAVYNNSIAIVISPLISLMEDQILSLTMSNIPACLLGPAQNNKKKTFEKVIEGQFRVVYMSPEFATGENGLADLQDIYKTNKVSLVAVDEAHCVSQWGHEFRPTFRNLWKLRNIFLNIPVLAVTATATPRVQEDIAKSLRLRDPLGVRSSFDRPNLFFEVRPKSKGEIHADLKSCMNKTSSYQFEFTDSTIIYCITKSLTDEICQIITGLGIPCVKYHAGMSLKERREAHENFAKDKIKCIVATIAFGMGIDKPDVRNIIHYGSSRDIESYYQEVGRAGRDGLPAKCTIFFNSADFLVHQYHLGNINVSQLYIQELQQRSNNMQKYLNTTECRRKFILRHFDDKLVRWDTLETRKNCCDNCLKSFSENQIKYEGMDEKGMYNIFDDAKLFLQVVHSLDSGYGMDKYCKLLTGSNSSTVPAKLKQCALFGKGKHKKIEWWKIIGRILNVEGYLEKRKLHGHTFISIIGITSKGSSFLFKDSKNLELKIMPPVDMMKFMKEKRISPPSRGEQVLHTSGWIDSKATSQHKYTKPVNVESQEEIEYRMKLYKILHDYRNELGHNEDCSPYMIASNSALMSMSKVRPKSLEEFKSANFDGMNDGRINKFGQKFIDIIVKYYSENKCSFETISASQASQQNRTGISGLKQFAFIENKIKIDKSEENQKSEPLFDNQDDDEFEISDAALNNIYDNLSESINIEANEIKNTNVEPIDLDATTCDLEEIKKTELFVINQKNTNTEFEKTNLQTKNENSNIQQDIDEDLLDIDWLDSNSEDEQTDSKHLKKKQDSNGIQTNTEEEKRQQGEKNKRNIEGNICYEKRKRTS